MRPNRTLIALAAGAALAGASATSLASSQTNDRTLVGAWRTVVTPVNCSTGQPVGAPPIFGLSTFNRGGTMSEWGVGPGTTPAMRSPGAGVWQRDRGWREYSFTFRYYRYDASGAFLGSQRVVADVELADNGDSYASSSSVEARDVNDNIVAAFCATSVGTRIE